MSKTSMFSRVRSGRTDLMGRRRSERERRPRVIAAADAWRRENVAGERAAAVASSFAVNVIAFLTLQSLGGWYGTSSKYL
jgi:hypothetical protein